MEQRLLHREATVRELHVVDRHTGERRRSGRAVPERRRRSVGQSEVGQQRSRVATRAQSRHYALDGFESGDHSAQRLAPRLVERRVDDE